MTRPVEVAAAAAGGSAAVLPAAALRTVRMMHLVERIAERFNRDDVPLMVLKGAALNLALYERPDERPMTDLDFMVRIEDLDTAAALLEELGCLRSEVVFREDYFPKYCYEIEYTAGTVDPVLMDWHVRPFRLLRYARLVREAELWQRARPLAIGAATVLMPAPDDMLIHLAAHSAIHGNCRELWLADIARWTRSRRDQIDWDRLLDTVERWRLGLPVLSAVEAAQRLFGPVCPPRIHAALAAMRPGWRDRLVLWHAPRDGKRRLVAFAINLLTTPGLRFKLGYLRDVLLPDRAYMNEWCVRHDCRGFTGALLRRCLAPLMRRLPALGGHNARIEVRRSGIHGLGVFARRQIERGEIIARYRGRPIDRSGTYVACHASPSGRHEHHEITGPLRFLNHSCRPNARLVGFRLIATRRIRAGSELTIDYGPGACDCPRPERGAPDGP